MSEVEEEKEGSVAEAAQRAGQVLGRGLKTGADKAGEAGEAIAKGLRAGAEKTSEAARRGLMFGLGIARGLRRGFSEGMKKAGEEEEPEAPVEQGETPRKRGRKKAKES